MPTPAERLDRLPPYIFVSIARKINHLQADGHSVRRLDIGNPDMPPPDHVVQQLTETAHDPTQHGYSGYRGVASFREAVAGHYARRFGVRLDPETEVLPLLGSKEGVVNLATAYLDPSDGVLVPEVGYPSYAMAARLAGARMVWVPMDPTNGYMLRVGDVSSTDAANAKLLWTNYPNNPTGGVITTRDYAVLVEFCKQHDILLASDNPYVEVTYDGIQAGSVLQVPGAKDHAVEFMSFSKAYNMAGWRLGAAVGNPEALRHLLHIKSNMDSGHFKAIYAAGVAALEATPADWMQARNAIYQRRRDMLLAALPGFGLEAQYPPQGAMYIWARVTTGESDTAYVDRALAEAHVSLAPGSAYGPGGAGFVRLSVGVPDAEIQHALDQLTTWHASRAITL